MWDTGNTSGQIGQHFHRQTVSYAAQFNFHFVTPVLYTQAAGISRIQSKVRIEHELLDGGSMAAQFLGTEDVFDWNDQPFPFAPRKMAGNLAKVFAYARWLDQANARVAGAQ